MINICFHYLYFLFSFVPLVLKPYLLSLKMSDNWRQTMINITDRIFPSLPSDEKVGSAFGMCLICHNYNNRYNFLVLNGCWIFSTEIH